jgi:hypothetical protein
MAPSQAREIFGSSSPTQGYSLSVSGKSSDPDMGKAMLSHVKAALGHLNLYDESARLLHPRHTDHDRHIYLPQRAAQEFAAARREIQAAMDELTADRQERS